MTRPASNRESNFLWLGVFILLPVILLAGLGLYSLQRDQRLADEEVRDRATWLVNRAHAILGPAVLTNLHAYLDHRLELRRNTNELVNGWFRYLAFLTNRASAPVVTNEIPPAFGYANYFTRVNSRNQANHWPDAHHLAFDQQLRFYPDYKPADPASRRFSPLRSGFRPFMGEDAAGQTNQQLLGRAHQLEGSSAPLDDVIKAYAAFLNANPPYEIDIPIRYILGMLEMKRGRTNAARGYWEEVRRSGGAWLPDSRLPVKPLALHRLAQLVQDEMPPRTFRDLCLAIVEQQSPITGLLFEKTQALLSPEQPAEQAMLNACRNQWELDRRTRDICETIRQTIGTPARTNRWSWMECRGHPCLLTIQRTNEVIEIGGSQRVRNAGHQPNAIEPMEPELRTNQFLLVSLFPRNAVEWAVQRAFADHRHQLQLPEGMALRLYWDEEVMVLGSNDTPPNRPVPVAPPIASVHASVFSEEGISHDLAIHAHTDYLSALYAPLHLRRRIFGALIGGAGLVALTGFFWMRRAFQRHIQLGEMKTNFVSSVSHELRAPIASIRLMAESLDRGKVNSPGKQRDYFRFIAQECRRLSSLIENVLDFARIEQGRKEYELEPTDLRALVSQTVQLMESYAQERKVQLQLHTPSSHPVDSDCQVAADGRAIQQALVNLIDNAIKHSPAGEIVTVGLENQTVPTSDRNHSTRGAGAKFILWVSDRGPGIPAAERDRIFERFYRRGSELRRETQGIGIGLNIVQHIAQAHGGRVTVESEPGQGSRFTIELPAE